MSGDEAIALLVAKQEITEVLYRYCVAMDTNDIQMARSVWHTDGTCDYGANYGNGPAAGFVEWVIKAHEATLARSHNLTNILIEVDLARLTAGSLSYVVAVLGRPTEEGIIDHVYWGRYLDRWSVKDGRWAIDHRQSVPDIDQAYPISAGSR